MRKLAIITTSLLISTFIYGTTSAATIKCTVDEVKDGKVTLTCAKEADTLKIGSSVILRPKVTRKAVEGC